MNDAIRISVVHRSLISYPRTLVSFRMAKVFYGACHQIWTDSLSHEYSVDITTCLRTSKDVGSTSTCLQDAVLWRDSECALPQNALWLRTSLWLNIIIAFRGYLNNLCTLFGVRKWSKTQNCYLTLFCICFVLTNSIIDY